uniref:Uncharacterized protein n=1 Tax=Timema tahoe TaxID=61484 RepID=A0A7R9IDJ9_9NEOP|nr:unnamed protein product [Timema tahoe]
MTLSTKLILDGSVVEHWCAETRLAVSIPVSMLLTFKKIQTRLDLQQNQILYDSLLPELPTTHVPSVFHVYGVMCFRVRVEYYVNENTFKERLQLYFIKNQRSSEYTVCITSHTAAWEYNAS